MLYVMLKMCDVALITLGMPKASSKSCMARKHEPTAKQHGNAEKTATVSDSSQWRASKIGNSVTVCEFHDVAFAPSLNILVRSQKRMHWRSTISRRLT